MQPDDYLEVRMHAFRTFALMTVTLGRFEILPEVEEIQEWWAKEGKNLTAKWKPLDCS